MTGVVVVGTGFGCFTHVRALRAAGFDVHALVGRDPEKTAERARVFDIPHATTSFTDALALSRVGAVTVATPPHTHAPLVLEAVAAGKHVLCEKPFARDVDEAERVLAATERAGVVHMLGTEFRFDTGQALLARVVRDGVIGTPRLATLVLNVPMLAEPGSEVPAWWARADQGGGWLGAHGSQLIDQVRVLLGEFRTVTTSLSRVVDRQWSADDAFVAHFVMRSGAVGMLQSTASDWGPMLIETRVVGALGTAWIEGLGETVRVADGRGTRTVEVPDDLRTAAPAPPPRGLLRSTYERMTGHGFDLGPYTRLAEHFLARIRGVEPPPGPVPATFVDGVAGMRALDAMRRSHADRCTVEIAEPER